MNTTLKLLAALLAGAAAGALGLLAASWAGVTGGRTAPAAPLVATGTDGLVHETLYFHAPEDGIAATHDGRKPIRVFPNGITPLDDKALASAFVLVAKARNRDGEIVGFASEMEDVAPETDILRGRMVMRSTWTVELPGRGTLFCDQVEDASEFARKVVMPAFLLGQTWDAPWTFVTTVGPGPLGRGVIVGGTGEFEGVTGHCVEVTHLRRFTPQGEMTLTMELQLAYGKPAAGSPKQ
ncbi:MAG: hypothetical protein JNL87_10770 [Burkholderiaceae bacterium]|nr:hypothetical protein [Burkholderiaceae bacterium]